MELQNMSQNTIDSSTLNLEIVDEVAGIQNIDQESIMSDPRFKPSEQRVEKIDKAVDDFVKRYFGDEDDIAKKSATDWAELTSEIDRIGDREAEELYQQSSRLSERRLKEIGTGDSNTKRVVNNLALLNMELEKIDPSRVDWKNPLRGGRFFGIPIPFATPKIAQYLSQAQTGREAIEKLYREMDNNEQALIAENAELRSEEEHNIQIATRQRENMYMTEKLIEVLKKKSENYHPQVKKMMTDHVLFPLYQKLSDLTAQTGVASISANAYNAMSKNNVQLLRGVNQARRVSIPVVHTAINMASTIMHTREINDSVRQTRQVGTQMLRDVAKMTVQVGMEVQKHASSEAVDSQALIDSFNDVQKAQQDVQNFRVKQVENMEKASKIAMKRSEEIFQSLSSNQKARLAQALRGEYKPEGKTVQQNGQKSMLDLD